MYIVNLWVFGLGVLVVDVIIVSIAIRGPWFEAKGIRSRVLWSLVGVGVALTLASGLIATRPEMPGTLTFGRGRYFIGNGGTDSGGPGVVGCTRLPDDVGPLTQIGYVGVLHGMPTDDLGAGVVQGGLLKGYPVLAGSGSSEGKVLWVEESTGCFVETSPRGGYA